MKSLMTSIALLSSFALPTLVAQSSYVVTDLGPLGPPPGQPYFIAGTGLTVGATIASGGDMHAVLWYKATKYDIATPGLGGPNSQATGVNNLGQTVGQAQTYAPNSEDFCGYTTLGLPVALVSCGAFTWQNGSMTQLSTLGGANASATSVNIHGEIAGLAETTNPQANCSVVNQFEAVTWKSGNIQMLPPYPGDLNGGAYAINDHGQVVGTSGSCAPYNANSGNYLYEAHALLWENGTPIDLGSFGGTGGFGGNHACAINNKGHVAGHSDLTGDTTTNAFLWTRQTGMQNLHTLPGDFASLAIGINDSDVIVGSSFDTNFIFKAIVWQNGVMTDLNTLIPSNSPLYLQLAFSINGRGEIVGIAQDSTGAPHGFLVTPTRNSGDTGPQPAVTPQVPSETTLRLLMQKTGIRPR